MRTILRLKKVRYSLAILAGVYALFSIVVCIWKFRVGLPILDAIPTESYAYKHMVNHLELFELAPIAILAFMKPIDYWNASEHRRIREFIDEAKRIKGMDRRFEWNWLQDVHDHAESNAHFR